MKLFLDETEPVPVFLWNEYIKRNEKGDEIVLVRHSKSTINLIKEVQKAMMQLFSERKYKVESNPTSNLMIGPFDLYKDLPTFKFHLDRGTGTCFTNNWSQQ